MRRAFFISVLGLALALAAYAGVYFTTTAPSRAEMCCATPELAWLTNEYKINDSQFATISNLYTSYTTGCKERCSRIMSLNETLRTKVSGAGKIDGEVEKDVAEIARLRGECQRQMYQHFVDVSHAMTPDEGHRYLAWVMSQTTSCQSGTNASCPMMMH